MGRGEGGAGGGSQREEGRGSMEIIIIVDHYSCFCLSAVVGGMLCKSDKPSIIIIIITHVEHIVFAAPSEFQSYTQSTINARAPEREAVTIWRLCLCCKNHTAVRSYCRSSRAPHLTSRSLVCVWTPWATPAVESCGTPNQRWKTEALFLGQSPPPRGCGP